MQITENFAAGDVRTYVIPGNYFRIIASTGPISVDFFRGSTKLLESLVGEDAGTWARMTTGFDRVVITSPTAQQIKFGISAGDVGSERIVGDVSVVGTVDISGNVNVVDNSMTRTISGVAFMAGLGQGGVAGQYAYSQLWNPVGSGKSVIVESIAPSQSSAGLLQVAVSDTAINNPAALKTSKYSLGAAPVAVARQANYASAVALGNGWIIASLQLQANVTLRVPLREPIVLEEGWGLWVQGNVVGSQVNNTPEWIEQ